jgi:hypothetical protein
VIGGGEEQLQRHGDGLHDAVRLGKDFQDALVVADVVDGQGAATAVFQPFLRGLVAADVEVP